MQYELRPSSDLCPREENCEDFQAASDHCLLQNGINIGKYQACMMCSKKDTKPYSEAKVMMKVINGEEVNEEELASEEKVEHLVSEIRDMVLEFKAGRIFSKESTPSLHWDLFKFWINLEQSFERSLRIENVQLMATLIRSLKGLFNG